MMRFVILLFFCGAIAGSNDTLSNVIPSDELLDLEEKNEENSLANNRTLNEIYEDAVHAYLDEDWDRCIQDFNTVSHGYKAYKRMITNCRRKCRIKAEGTPPIFPQNIEDLHFYERKIKETLCLLTCNNEYREIVGSNVLKMLPRETEQKLLNNGIYEYLHICYYQTHRYQDAANALFTYLVLHSNHEVNLNLFKRYLTLPGVEEEKVVNLETPTYVSVYFKGVSAYENGDYAEAAGLFETSLRSYLEAEEECRFYCEGPFDQGWHPEFTSSIANHFTYCLKCKRSCSRMLNNINGDYRRHMLRSHYDYLQFSYYKLGNLKAACAAVGSFLLFDPVDKTMLQNKEYYNAQPKVKVDYFTPREDAINYVKRQEYELNLLHYISNEFSVINEKFQKIKKEKRENETNNAEKKELGKISDTEAILHPPPGYSLFYYTKLSNNFSMKRFEDHKIHDKRYFEAKNDIYLKEEDLGGQNRYVADGFLNSTECESMMQFATMTAVEGDGYSENKSPHSKYEKFEGITVGRAALMVYFGQIKPEWLELLLEKTEQVRDHVERYFGLNHRHLYFTYTHLVCRTALPDSPVDRDDLSHQVHADNCLLKDRDVCLRESPAYIWRDYSAILYLNDDFQGGEFFFTKDRVVRTMDNVVSPHCGRIVAFSAGKENLHGVRGILRGKRCALALWFTQDKKYLEYERVLASAILKRVQRVGPFEGKDIQVPPKYEDMLIQYMHNDELLKHFLKSSL
ncbi:prolyl 3-hydroxylase 1-like isoform X1 [Bombus affinis]|uniref:prolyl 3-hydroxylase 1-like isoform X1 n=1 Tax=Bombus affinis TaxID=309941 RepID=UPI0021B7240D|nr:prolyl 3-hydroxylase 1-like isoform X1 [Bombus affinis]